MSKQVIDEKVVEMKFDNSNFEKNVSQTMSSLEKLKQSLKFGKSTETELNKLSKSMNTGTSSIIKSLDALKNNFSVLDYAISMSLSNIVNNVVSSSKRLVSSLSFDQISSGWDKYADKTSAVQTIMAATSKDFTDTGEQMEYVNEQLGKLNWFTDETSYNFLDMVSNIGKFTSNNIKLDKAVTSMQGIALWAARSGANTNEASRAMYNLSQAISTGSVKSIDWISIENANMATAEFKENVLEIAAELGTLKKKANGAYETLKGKDVSITTFKQNLSEEWFTSDVLLKTLDRYGEFTNKVYETYERLGEIDPGLTTSELLDYVDKYKEGTLNLSEAFDTTKISADELKTIFDSLSSEEMELGLASFKIGQEAKTFAEALGSVKDAVSSKWMDTFEIIFGDYEEAKKVWTSLANDLYDLFAAGGDARNEYLKKALHTQYVEVESWEKLVKETGDYSKLFQNEIIKTAKAHGIAVDEMIADTGSFEESLKKGWLSTDIITETLNKFSGAVTTTGTNLEELEVIAKRVMQGEFGNGADRIKKLTEAGYDYATVQSYVNHLLLGTEFNVEGLTESMVGLSDEQLKNLGYTEEQIEYFRELAKQADKTGTPINELIASMNKPTGRELLLGSFKNLLDVVLTIKNTASEAWNEIFNSDPEGLYKVIEKFNEFTKSLTKINEKTDELKRTFKGVFAILDIVKTVFSELFGGVFDAIGSIINATGLFNNGILDVTASIGDQIVAFSKWIKENSFIYKGITAIGNILSKVVLKVKDFITYISNIPAVSNAITNIQTNFGKLFDSISKYLGDGLEKIGDFLSKISEIEKIDMNAISTIFKSFRDDVLGYFFNFDGLFDNINFGNIGKNLSEALASIFVSSDENFLSIFQSIGDIISSGFKSFTSVIKSPKSVGLGVGKNWGTGFLSGIWQGLKDGLSSIADVMSDVGSSFMSMIGKIDFNKLFLVGTISSVLGIANKMADAFKNISAPIMQVSKILESVKGVFDTLKSSIVDLKKAKVQQIQAGTFKTFAEAILMIAGAIVAISMIKQEDLIKAGITVGAIAGALLAIMGAMEVITIINKKLDIKQANADLGKLSLFIISLGGAMLLISWAIGNIDKVNDPWNAVGVIIALSVIIGLLIAVSKLAGEHADKAAQMFLKMAAAMFIMTYIIRLVSGYTEEEINKGQYFMNGVAVLFSLFTAVSVIAGEHASKAGTMLLKIAVAMLILVGIVKLVSGFNQDELAKGVGFLVIVGIMFNAFIGLSKFANKNVDDLGSTILKITTAILLLAVVIRLVAGFSADDITKGVIFIGACSLFFLGVIKVSELAGRHANKAGDMLLKMSAAILILVGVMYLISFMKPEDVFKGIIYIGSILVLFALVIAASKLAGEHADKAGKMLLKMSAAMLILSASVIILSFINENALQKSMGVITAIMAMFALVIMVSAMAGEHANKAGNMLLKMTIPIIALSIAMYYLGKLDPTNVGVAALALDSLMVCMGILALMSKDIKLSLVTVAGLVVIIATLVLALGYLAAFPADNVLASAVSLTTVLLAVTAAVKLLGNMPVYAGAAAALNVLEFIGILGLVIIALGALFENVDGLDGLLDKGIEVFEKIGNAIGKFVGGIIGGIGEGIADSLPAIGKQLTAFTKTAEPFITMFSGMEAGSFDGVESLVNAILGLAGTDLLNKVSGMFGESKPEDLKKQFQSLGEGLMAFATATDGIPTESVDAAAAVAGKLVDIANSIPGTGGIWQKIVGEKDLAGFSDNIGKLGNGIKAFATNVEGISNTDSVKDAIDIAGKLIDLSNSIEDSGWIAKIFGNSDMGVFADDLAELGTALADYYEKLKYVPTDKLLNSVAVIVRLTEIMPTLTDLGTSVDNLKELLTTLPETFSLDIGASIEAFASSFEGLGIKIVNHMANGIKSPQAKMSMVFAFENLLSAIKSALEVNEEPLRNAAISIANSMASELSSYYRYKLFYEAGEYLVEGFTQGIKSNRYKATLEAIIMANNAVNAVNKILGIHSPSKVFYKIGNFTIMGFVNALQNGISNVYNSAKQLGLYAVDGVNNGVNLLSDILALDIDYEPTISPVLDLDNVTSGINKMNSMFDLNPALSASIGNVNAINSIFNKTKTSKNDDVVSAIHELNNKLDTLSGGDTYNVNGVTYDDGSNVSDAVKDLIRAARVERRK